MPSVKVSLHNLRLLTALKAMKLLDEHREIHRDEVLTELVRVLEGVIRLIDTTKTPPSSTASSPPMSTSASSNTSSKKPRNRDRRGEDS